MATQYTSILKLALPTQGELDGTWGGVVNDNITSMVEEAIAGLSTINTWTTDSHTLTTANGVTSESRAAMLVLTDTGTALTGAGEVICPTATKIYIVKNDTGQTITVKTSAGTGVDIPTGTIRIVFCDGTNVVQASASLSGLGVTATATELNVLDGITSTTAELNILDGVTADAAEINILDGATLTTTELNYVDGVTSGIQAQFTAVSQQFDGTTPVTGIDINSGSIDGTPIGASSASSGAFTTISGTDITATSVTADFVDVDFVSEGVYSLTGTAINPANGTMQYKTLAANTTFTENLTSGTSVVLRIIGGDTYTVTWPTIIWVTTIGNTAPTLEGDDFVVLWKEGSTLYGVYVGNYA
jgi:hypothetical protein